MKRNMDDYVSKNSLQIARETSDKWEKKYYAEHQRIVDLALAHLPEVTASNEDDLPGIGKTIKQPQLVCNAKNCAYFWPCPMYLWATGSEPFTVQIERKAVKP